MNGEFFREQIARLRGHFKNQLSDEYVALLSNEVAEMPEQDFLRAVNVLIGESPRNKPPKLSFFREARAKVEKRDFERDVAGAAAVVFGGATPGERRAHVLNVLSAEFGPVRSVSEALEIARLRLRLGEADQDA